MNWTADRIPSQQGRVAVVTGANSGIGFETAKALAAKGASVVMACRNPVRAEAAADAIRREVPGADLDLIALDLADLNSIRSFAETFAVRNAALDMLINNAGVMVPPLGRTRDGFELQFGANHLGHFALTGLLLDRILATPRARVVTVSSGAHRMGKGTLDFDNLNAERGYKPWDAYAQSKLANLLFTFELNRRFAEAEADAIAVAAHPGWTLTSLQNGFMRTLTGLVAQRPPMGALPTLYAATAPGVLGDDYFGPDGWREIRGHPEKVDRSAASQDPDLARRLWAVSEEMTGVTYEMLGTGEGSDAALAGADRVRV